MTSIRTSFRVNTLPASIAVGAACVLTACGGGGGGGGAAVTTLAAPSQSTSITLTSDDRKALVVNGDTNSLAVIGVRNAEGADVFEKLAEIPVGKEPHSVAVSPDGRWAYVSNTVSGTVSVIALKGKDAYETIREIVVGTEPRGLALTPNGSRLFVANHTNGTVSIIDTKTLVVIDTVVLGGNPTAVAISHDGDRDDEDETVYVTQFFAELVPGGPGETFDTGKQGVVHAFSVAGGGANKITLAPMANAGFTADRKLFCTATNAGAHSNAFCPDVNITDPSSPVLTQDPQGAFPNQLHALTLRNGRLYVPSIGAGPEPPVKFNVNVQSLVHVVDALGLADLPALTVNLNAQVKTEAAPADPTTSLGKLFGNDIVAIHANVGGTVFFVVSRGGNFVFRCTLDGAGALTIGAPDVVRFQTGNLPTGIVVSTDGKRAYTNNSANLSMTAIDLDSNLVIERDVPTGTPPIPGTFEHAALVGKLAFHTALGMADFGVFTTGIREIVPLQHRNKASDNAWSSCASCHPSGLTDNVSWMFATGPRSTLPLDAFFSKANSGDQRISNWSAVMGSVTDFNNNARGVQGGKGFAGDPPPTSIFQHGVTTGGSDSLDAMTIWVQTIRSPILPAPTDALGAVNGASIFEASCATCHGGNKWTKSQVVYGNNPTLTKDAAAGGVPFDPGLVMTGPQATQYTRGTDVLKFLEGVGTFDATNPTELRGNNGTTALGAAGFNVPSLLGLAYTAPYLHDGSAQTLAAVFARHRIAGPKGPETIADLLTPQELADLQQFLLSIDAQTSVVASETDAFLK